MHPEKILLTLLDFWTINMGGDYDNELIAKRNLIEILLDMRNYINYESMSNNSTKNMMIEMAKLYGSVNQQCD